MSRSCLRWCCHVPSHSQCRSWVCWGNTHEKSVWRLIKKKDIKNHPAISLLAIETNKCKSIQKSNTCTPMFIEALFTIAKLWNHMLSAREWMELLIVVVNKTRQAQKVKYHTVLLIC
jgi:hypothetical protein